MLNKKQQKQIVKTLLPYRPLDISIFGSYAKNTEDAGSDLDILISLDMKISLLKLIEIQYELSDILGLEVDLVTKNSLKNSLLRNSILSTMRTIYNVEKQSAIS